MTIGNKNKGQQAIEFILISSLVLLGALATILLFGGKIASFFSNDSAVAIQSKKTSSSINSSSKYFASNSESVSNSPINNSNSINGVNVDFRQDGSASFTINNQQINLSTSSMNNLNTVFQTTGSSGLTSEVVQAIKDIVTSNSSSYPGQNVPVQISFGTGLRNQANTADLGGGAYQGSAVVNSVTIAVGDTYKIIQKDQDCPSQGVDHCGFVSTVSVTKDYNSGQATGTVTSDISTMNNTTINCNAFSSTGLPTSCGVSSSNNFGGASWDFTYTSASQNI